MKLTRLPGQPFSSEFMDALATLRALPKIEVKVEPGAARTKPGTVDALIAKYKSSIEFIRARPNSQAQYQRMLDKLGADLLSPGSRSTGWS